MILKEPQTMPRLQGSWMLLATLLIATAVGCKKSTPEPAPVPPAATAEPTPPPVPPAPAPVSVATIELGRQVGADKRVSQPMTTFSPQDTIYVSVSTEGASESATLTARWTFETGQLVTEGSETIAPTGPASTEFHVEKPTGWPAGKYKVEILLNGSPAGTKEFEVKK
jgi:hypothetical protein